MRIRTRIQIQLPKMMRVHADPDPQHCLYRYIVETFASQLQDEIFSKVLVSWQQNIYLHWLTLGEYGTLTPYICKSTGTCASFKHGITITSNLRDP
jgi:hypothetical protein